MHRPIEISTTPAELVRIVFRHRAKVLAWCVLVGVAAAAAVVMLPRKYQSDAKLFVRLGRESVTLDPTATTGTNIAVLESRENQLNSVRDMLQSRTLFEAVAKQVGPDVVLNGSSEPSQWSLSAMLSRITGPLKFMSGPATDNSLELATEKLSKSIGVTLARNSSVINLYCTAGSPKIAQDELQAFVEAYQEQHLEANRTSGSLEFFAKQTEEIKQELDKSTAALRDAKNESGLVSILAEQQALQQQMIKIEADAFDADAELASTDAAIAALRKALEDLPTLLTTQETSGYPNTAADNMRQEIFKLEMTAGELEAKLGQGHPLVKVQEQRLAKLEKILALETADRVQTTKGLNPAREALILDLRKDEALAESLRAKTVALKGQYADMQKRLRTLNEYEVRINELTRENAIAESNYKRHADHLEQARVVAALEDSRISSVNVVQPPSLIEKSIYPKKSLILALAFAAALFGSLALPFCFEYLGRLLDALRAITGHSPAPSHAPISHRGPQASLS